MDVIGPGDEDLSPELSEELRGLQRQVHEIELSCYEARRGRLKEEPRCPECRGGVLRSKCFLELGPGCPRHEIVEYYGGNFALHRRLQELT